MLTLIETLRLWQLVTSARSVSHSPGQLNILRHDGDHLGVDCAEIDVLEQGAESMREEVPDQGFVEHPHSSETSCGLGGLCRAQHSFD